MLVFLMLSRVRDLGFNFNLWLVFPPALLLFIGGLMLVGYIDVTYGLLAQEQEVQGRKHPIFKEIRDMIRELDRKIERLNKQ